MSEPDKKGLTVMEMILKQVFLCNLKTLCQSILIGYTFQGFDLHLSCICTKTVNLVQTQYR